MQPTILSIIALLGIMLFSWCTPSSPKTPMNRIHEWAYSPKENTIEISCDEKKSSEIIQNIQNIAEDTTTTVSLAEDCRTKRIPGQVLDGLVKKPLFTVHWFPEFPTNSWENVQQKYVFSAEEILRIAKSNWKWLAIENLTPEQYKVLRNEKTPVREGFEPVGSSHYYTQEEQKKCDSLMKSYSGSDETVQSELSDKRVACYKNLPPLP